MEFQAFDSFEEAIAFMQEAEEQANDRVTAEQAAIGWGDFFIRAYEDFIIFGAIPTLEEVAAKERSYYPEVMDADSQEYDSIIESLKERYERGYRFARAYSIVEPEGELGDTHISVMTKITREQFVWAEECGWDGYMWLQAGINRGIISISLASKLLGL